MMRQKDFDKLCKSIKDSISDLSKIVGDGLGETGNAVGDAIGSFIDKGRSFAADQQSKGAKAPDSSGRPDVNGGQHPNGPQNRGSYPNVNQNRGFTANQTWSRFRSSLGLRASGIVFIILGALFGFAFGVSAIVGPFVSPIAGFGLTVATEIVLAALTGVSLWGLAMGVSRVRLSGCLDAFRRIFGNREACSIEELSARAQMTPRQTRAMASKLIKRGLLPHGRMDAEGTTLMVTDDAYRLYQQAQQAFRQRSLEQQAEAQRQRWESQVPAGIDPQTAQFIKEGKGYLASFRELDRRIDDVELSERIVTIEGLVERIVKRVEDEPELVGGLRRLTDYYLPTTVKLLNAYDELEEQPVQGENIAASRAEIEQTLDMLCEAYAKLLDATFQDMTMDVSTDVAVLQAMLARDGLTDAPFDSSAQPSHNRSV